MSARKNYRYYCLFRPPVPGAIPRGTVGIFAFDARRYVDEIGREAWGFAEYEWPLSPQDVVNFELAVAGDNPCCDTGGFHGDNEN